MIYAVTGPRPQHLTHNQRLDTVREVHDFVDSLDPASDLLISGMALGVDTWAAERAVYRKIPFWAYVPFASQADRWEPDQKAHWDWLITRAAVTVLCSTGGYAAWKFQKRNERMVDDADALAAFYLPGKTGGTLNCMNYAVKTERFLISHPIH